MAKYDVYRHPSGNGYLVDCQANLLSDFNTRFVVPLLSATETRPRAPRLNPVLDVDGEPHILVTQFAGSIAVRLLGEPVASLIDEDLKINNAIDMLLSGY
ncbi:MAG: CcdB family protein [Sphingomonadaceae bacterium]|nr:CcdB family protein [Sphingomonadaceae bacterium]